MRPDKLVKGKEVWWPDSCPSNYGAQHGVITDIKDNVVIVRDDVENRCAFYKHAIYNTTSGISVHKLVSNLYETEQDAIEALRDPFAETFCQENEPGMWWLGEKGDDEERIP